MCRVPATIKGLVAIIYHNDADGARYWPFTSVCELSVRDDLVTIRSLPLFLDVMIGPRGTTKLRNPALVVEHRVLRDFARIVCVRVTNHGPY